MISQELQEELLGIAKEIGNMTDKTMQSLNRFVESEEFKAIVEYLSRLPKDVQETDLFKMTKSFHNKEISYSDACWLRNVIVSQEYYTRRPKRAAERSKLDDYICSIIESSSMGKREKVAIILIHFESLIYQKINYTRNCGDKIRIVTSKRMKDTHGLSSNSIEMIIIAAICFVVFSATDYYKNAIDKRIPFRNEIVHNGTLQYSDEEIDNVYEILVDYTYVLLDMS